MAEKIEANVAELGTEALDEVAGGRLYMRIVYIARSNDGTKARFADESAAQAYVERHGGGTVTKVRENRGM